MYDKMFYKCDVTGSRPLPLSQTVTPSRTPSPSSVTYFMDVPYLVPAGPFYPLGTAGTVPMNLTEDYASLKTRNLRNKSV